MGPVKADLLQGDVVVAAGLEVAFLHGGALVHDAASWSGSFRLPPGCFLALGGPYRLRLGDGREGLVLVQELRPEGGEVEARFAGVGPLPHREPDGGPTH